MLTHTEQLIKLAEKNRLAKFFIDLIMLTKIKKFDPLNEKCRCIKCENIIEIFINEPSRIILDCLKNCNNCLGTMRQQIPLSEFYDE